MPKFTVTVENGSGDGVYVVGASVTIEADKLPGYCFKEWKVVSGDVTIVDDSFTMPASDVVIKAVYEPNKQDGSIGIFLVLLLKNRTFDIEATATEGGTITPEGVSEVRYNKDITYTITADEGYAIEAVIVDGEDVGAVSEYTFENVRNAHTIHVIFKAISAETDTKN